jgi:hypothetical protein
MPVDAVTNQLQFAESWVKRLSAKSKFESAGKEDPLPDRALPPQSRPVVTPKIEPRPLVELNIKPMGKPEFKIQLKSHSFIYAVKKEIERVALVPFQAQRLLVKGKGLSDHWRTLVDYGIENGSTLTLMIKQAPGSSVTPSAPTPMDVDVESPPQPIETTSGASGTPQLPRAAKSSFNPKDLLQKAMLWTDIKQVLGKHLSNDQEVAKVIYLEKFFALDRRISDQRWNGACVNRFCKVSKILFNRGWHS